MNNTNKNDYDPSELFSETNPNDIHLEVDEHTNPYLSATPFAKLNNPLTLNTIPEVPFVHWSIYRQGIQNLLT